MADHWYRVVSISIFLSLLVLSLLFDCTVQQQQQQVPISWQDRLALIQLRSSLGIRARDWPIKSDPCSVWVGIHCSNGTVRRIDISGFRRTRQGSRNPQFAVDALRNLTLLSEFNASNFNLPGQIPQWFGLQLGALQVLDLRYCSINGVIPATLGNLTSLVQLYLSDNDLSGEVPLSLSQLVGLSVLDLSRNLLSGSIPGGFTALVNLTLLDMSSNQLAEVIPPGIGALSRLKLLNLSNNNLSSSIPAQLGNLSSLVDLDLGFNLLSGRLPGNLFDKLTQLQSVVLRRNRFTGGLPEVLWSIGSLRFLDVSANNFTRVLPNVSSSVDTSSTSVNISWNLFYGNITLVLRRFGSIDISGNYFEGPVPNYARANTSLARNCLRNAANQRSLAECTSFYAKRNLVFDNFGQPTAAQPPPARSNRRKKRLAIIYGSVFGGIGIVLLLILPLILLIVWKRNRGTSNQRGISVGPVPAGGSPSSPGLPQNLSTVGDTFTYKQILQITGEFNDENLISHGHSGDFFRGVLEGGLQVVVKKVDLNSSVRKDSYMSELDLFSKVSHPRLVPFLGHCLENENEKFLVYKCMPNGNLSSALFKKTASTDSLQSLDWITRLKIAIGAAEGLSYLHHECSPPLVHRDVQASSILLDDKYEVRLGSLSEVCVQEGDSHQSRITRLLRLPQSSEQGSSGTSNASCAYDVYCFGKVLLELVTGMLGISSSTGTTTKEFLDKTLPYISIYDKELVPNIIDPSLIIDDDLLEEVWAMAIVARSCLNPKPARRPLMRYILKALENPLKVVRDEHNTSARLRTTSSRGSWNASTLFGSWRLSSSDVATSMAAPSRRVEHASSFKQSGTTGSQGSGQIGDGNGNGVSPSTRRNSKEIFPEPVIERLNGD